MIRLNKNQNGIGSIELFVLVAAIVALGLIGYKVYSSRSTDSTSTQTVSHKTSAADLKKTSDSLDAQPIDKNLDPAQLDQDLNALL